MPSIMSVRDVSANVQTKKMQTHSLQCDTTCDHKQHEVLGVNYEGHKITRHVLARGAKCVLNMQIAMDAPFMGETAEESTRAKGKSCYQMFAHTASKWEHLKQNPDINPDSFAHTPSKWGNFRQIAHKGATYTISVNTI